MTLPPLVHIHYVRPPDREEVFSQYLVLDQERVKVTLAPNVPFHPPIRILGEVALEKGSDAVWFTFPGRWHDIGRFHLADDTFTGIYANILTPVEIRDDRTWHTTDLYLDLWLTPDGTLRVLDEDQLEEALAEEWISRSVARRAREEVGRIREANEKGDWPPGVVREWTLERARAAYASSSTQAAARRPRSR